MGANNSTSINAQTILEEATTNIVSNVLNVHSTSVSVDQDFNFSCDPDVYINAGKLCEQDKANYYNMVTAITLAGRDPPPPYNENVGPCTFCSAVGVSADAVVSISSDSTNTAKIANDIKNEMLNQLQNAIDTKSSGPVLSFTDTDIVNLTNIKKSIQNNFKSDVVNKTILNYTYKQSIKSNNQSLKNINQKLVASGISKSIISNLMDNDSTFKSSIESLNTVKSVQTNPIDSIGNTISNVVGSFTSMFSSIYIIMVIVAIVIFIMFKDIIFCFPLINLTPLRFLNLCKKNNTNNNNNQYQPQYPYQYQPQYQPQYQQQYQPGYPITYQKYN